MVEKLINTEPTGGKLNEGLSRGFICRLDFENTHRMEIYLAKKGCSFSSFMKDVLEREIFKKEENVTIKMPKMPKSNKITLNQMFDFRLCPLFCPKCDDQEMSST